MNVIERINSKYLGFSRSQKQIADYVIKNTYKACFLSLKDFAEEVGVSQVTIINFSKKIGLASFSEFKDDLQTYIQGVLSPSDKIINIMQDMDDKDNKLQEVIKLDIEALDRTIKVVNIMDINKAVEIIKFATRVYLVGQSASAVVTEFLSFRMNMLGLDVVKFDMSSYSRMAIEMSRVRPSDVFIIVTFPRYSKKPIVLSEYLSELGNKIISITDKNISPVARRSDVVFTCATDTFAFHNSMTAPLSISNLLVSALAFEMEEILEENNTRIREAEERLYEISRMENY